MLFYTRNQEIDRSGWWGAGSNAYVVGIVDADGKLVPKSDSNTVRIPFDSEYGILLKNTTGYPCAVTIEIDGTSILGEEKIELQPKSKIIVDRFCIDGDLAKGKRLKFVTKDSKEVQDPSSEENGNVIVTFIPSKVPERPVVTPRGIGGLTKGLTAQGMSGSLGYSYGYSSGLRGIMLSDSVSDQSQNIGASLSFDSNQPQQIMYCSTNDADVFQDVEAVSDVGATVEGQESSQIFEEGKKLDLQEDKKFVLSFNLRGEVPIEDKSVEGKFLCKAGFSLDRSSSMGSKRDAAIDGFNSQLAKLKESPENVKTTVTFGTFATEVDEFQFEDKPVALVPEINRGNYVPNGSTSMLDGVGEMIEKLYTSPNAHDENTSFLVVIVTDGEENSSDIYDWEDIAQLITGLQNTGRWTFVYLGTNQDLAEVQKNMGLSAGNVRLFNDSSQGYAEGSAVTSASTGQYLEKLSRGIKSADNFYDQ